jgi:type IV secretory pathway VirB10-like protein
MNSTRTLLLALFCALPALAMAQWQWIDQDGRKVFSDQPPPPETPASKILRQPSATKGGKSLSIVPQAPASAAIAASAPAPKLSGKDRALEDKRKAAEAAEADKKKEQDEQVAKARAENCTRAKRAKAEYDSGMRVARLNDKGEREVLDDAQRAAESKRMAETIAKDCVVAQ